MWERSGVRRATLAPQVRRLNLAAHGRGERSADERDVASSGRAGMPASAGVPASAGQGKGNWTGTGRAARLPRPAARSTKSVR